MTDNYVDIHGCVAPDDFRPRAEAFIRKNVGAGIGCAIATIDIDHFNYINDLFGFDIGDQILEKITCHFSNYLLEGEFFTKLHSDVFAFCLYWKSPQELTNAFEASTNWQDALKDSLPTHYSLKASGGIIKVQDTKLSVSALLDRASYARKKSKNSEGSSFRYYDDAMSSELQWQKIVTLSMKSALKNGEFEMYLQPKIAIKNDLIIGAEALVRWNSPEHGLITPNLFIPIFEQNGFICQLDFYMLEQACAFLKECAANGLPQLPISVNFSKLHLDSSNLVERIFHTVNSAKLSTKLIEIEFTESISLDSYAPLVEVVTDLKLMGFRVSLDDFGSTYSSLNCLKDLPVDIIKIDKGFLDASSNTEKGKLIITKVVELIKSMRILSVMEGVETSEQLEFLRKLNCDFAQGYLFAKPMPVADYCEFLKICSHDPDIQTLLSALTDSQAADPSDLYIIPQEFQMDNWELYTLGKNIDMGLIKGYVDGEATIQYINDRALEYLGYTRQELREVLHNNLLAFIHPDDIAMMQQNTKQLIDTGLPNKFQIKAIRKDGKSIVLQGRSSSVIDNHGRCVGIYAFQDVTEELERTEALQASLTAKVAELEKLVASEREAREALRLSEERYRLVVDQRDDIMFEWNFETDTIFFSEKHTKTFGKSRVSKNVSTNPDVRGKIHPEDLPAFERWIESCYQKTGRHQVDIRNITLNGDYIWVSISATAICDEAGKPLRAIGVLTNISTWKG